MDINSLLSQETEPGASNLDKVTRRASGSRSKSKPEQHAAHGLGTAGMDALADVAAMQQHQHTPSSGSGDPHIITKSEATSRLRDTSFENVSSEVVANEGRQWSAKSLSEDELATLAQAADMINRNPFAFQGYVQLIAILHHGLRAHSDSASPQTYELLGDLQAARQNMSARFGLGEELWDQWIQDQIALSQTLEDKINIREMCEKAVQEEPHSTRLWMTYGQWMQGEYESIDSQKLADEEKALFMEFFDRKQMLAIWQRAAADTLWRMNDSHLPWNTYTELMLQDIGTTPSSTEVAHVKDWFVSRLQIPHAKWEETSQIFSTFISQHDNANWEDTMVMTNKLGQEAKHKLAIREFQELKLLSDDRDAECNAFHEYLELEINTRTKEFSFELTNALFQRATLRFWDRGDFWQSYVNFLSTKQKNNLVLEVSERATKHCPWSGELWANLILAAEIAGVSFTDISEVKHRATSAGLIELGDMEEVLKVTTAWCGFLRRRAFLIESTDEEIDVAEVGILSAVEDLDNVGKKKYGSNYQGDPQCRLERSYIQYLTQSENISAARDVYDQLCRKRGSSYDFWLRYYHWELDVWTRSNDSSPPVRATKVLQRAIARSDLDWPDKVLDTYFYHCEDFESAPALQLALAEVSRRRKLLLETRAHDTETPAKQDVNGADERKRKRDDQDDLVSKRARSQEPHQPQTSTIKRDRENATIVVKALPADVTELQIRRFFTDCGTVNSIAIVEEASQTSATIEFETKEDALAALTKNMKLLNGQPIEIHQVCATTLYICNYPATADEKWIRDHFEKYGDIESVRLPSLKYNTHRRFAYVQFRHSTAAQAALELDGQELSDGLKLSVKMSDPAQKKDREGAIHEGREVFVSNVPHTATWKDLKTHFAQFGSVEGTRIPRKLNGSSKGIGFVVFRHREDAEKSLILNDTEWQGRTLVVVPSTADPAAKQKPQARDRSVASPAPVNVDAKAKDERRTDIQSRTLAIMNVPDTVNEARIRALVQTFGIINKLVLQPMHQGAIIEFEEQASLGKASLALAGHEIEPGRSLAVGTVEEMKKHRAEKRSDKNDKDNTSTTPALPAPALIRRPAQLAAGRRGGKGGLGLKGRGVGMSGERATINGNATPAANEAMASHDTKLRSNSDFKAMFIDK